MRCWLQRASNCPTATSWKSITRWLRDALAQEPPDFPRIVAALGAILDALAQTRTPADPDALQKLNQVFEVPPFKSREVPSAWNNFWSGVGNAIANFFEQLFNRLPQPPNITPPAARPPTMFGSLTATGWVLLVLGALLILALIIYTLRGVRRTVTAEARVRAEAEIEEHMTVQEATDRTRSAAQSGDYRTATRYLYLSTLLVAGRTRTGALRPFAHQPRISGATAR